MPKPTATPAVAPALTPPLYATAITAAAPANRPTDSSPSKVSLDSVSSREPSTNSKLMICRAVRLSSSRFSVQGVKAIR